MMNEQMKTIWNSADKNAPVYPSCSIYYRKKEFYVISCFKARDLRIKSDPTFHTKNLLNLGSLVMQSLTAFRHIPDYDMENHDYSSADILKPYGFDTWVKFSRGSILIPVTQKEDLLVVRKYSPQRGRVLGTVNDPKYTCEAGPEGIVKLVAELLDLQNPFQGK